MKKSYSAYEIRQAFRQLREQLIFDGKSKDEVYGENFFIVEVEQMLMDMLQGNGKETAVRQAVSVDELKDASLNKFNDALFG